MNLHYKTGLYIFRQCIKFLDKYIIQFNPVCDLFGQEFLKRVVFFWNYTKVFLNEPIKYSVTKVALYVYHSLILKALPVLDSLIKFPNTFK